MKLERIDGALFLHITPKAVISFLEEWVERLRVLPVTDYGLFMRDTVYPALSVHDRKVWHRSQFSNQDLFIAIQEFK